MLKQTALSFILLITFVACTAQQSADVAPSPTAAVATATPATTKAESQPQEPTPAVEPTSTSPPAPSTATAMPTNTPLPQTATPAPTQTVPPTEEAVAAIEPIEVTYFTPAQGEGPYYPVEKLADQDNDLTVLAGATGSPAGEIVEFDGKIYDANGWPIEGLTVEIWQTDSEGVYLHPGDPQTAQRDQNFQFYGESVTTGDGSYSFRTILPGQYEPRPRHIHLKIKDGQEELLTSQIYFQGDASLEADGLFLSSGNESIYLIMALAAGSDTDGNPVLVGEHNIVLDAILSDN